MPVRTVAQTAAADEVLFDVVTERSTTYLARAGADGSRFRRVTRPNRQYAGHALSPDRQLVMLHSSPGVVIDIATPTGGDWRRVFTATANQWSFGPVWSPDSSELLVTADRGSGPELLAVPADGTEPVHLAWAGALYPAYNVAPAAWSPDGALGIFRGLRDVDGTEQPAYFRVRRTGGGLQELSVGPAAARPELVWSADGRRFAVLRGDPGRQRIVVFDASGEVRRRLTPRQPVGDAATVGSLAVSSGGTVLSWSYVNYVGNPFTRAEGVFFHDVARRRTCRRAAPDQNVWGTTETHIEFRARTRTTVDTKPCRAS